MPIAFDNSVTQKGGLVNGITADLNIAAGASLFVIGYCSQSPDFCTWNTHESLTQIAGGSQASLHTVVWFLKNPTPGNYPIVFSQLSASAEGIAFIAVSLTGVNQTISTGATVYNKTGLGTSMSDSITLLYNDSWTIECQYGNSVPGMAITQSSSQTERGQLTNINSVIAAATKPFTTPGANTLEFGCTNSSLQHVIVEVVDISGIPAGDFFLLF